MKRTQILDYPAVIYDLSEHEELMAPFCELLLEDGGEKFSLGPDGEEGKLDIWENDNFVVTLVNAIFEDVILEFLDTVHPQFKGMGRNYLLEKDAWLNSPRSWQGTRIHRHWEPFLKPSDIGDVVTVLYPKLPEGLSEDNGALEFYAPAEEGHLDHVWLPESLTPTATFIPKQYNLAVFTTDTWHRARPFVGERYSLATDVKAIRS